MVGCNVRVMKRAGQSIPQEIWILIGAAFLVALGYGIMAPIIPQFATSFGVGVALAASVVSVFSFSRLVFAPTAGKLVDTLGSPQVYMSGLVIVAVTTGMVALSTEFWHIALLRGLSGFGSTMFTVSAASLIISLSPPTMRGRCSSAYSFGFLLGNIIGPIVGSGLSFLGMRWPFVIYGTMMLIATFVVWLRMPRDVGTVRVGQDSAPMLVREAWSIPTFRVLLFSVFAIGWVIFGLRVSIVPLFIASRFDNGAAIAGLAITASAVGAAVSMQFAGRLSDRYGRKPLIVSGALIAGVFTATFGFSDSIVLVLALSCIASFGSGMMTPAMQASLGDLVGSHRNGGKVLAFYQMATDCGAIAGPPLVGMISQVWGFGVAFALSGALFGLAALQWLWGKETLGWDSGHVIR